MKHNIKLYKYYFKQLEKPLVMEAESRKLADEMLMSFNDRIGGGMDISDLIDVRIETLIVGESSKIKNKKKHIWVGTDNTRDGWMELDEYLQIVIKNKKQQNEN
jgi:hypothetical protein